MVSPSRPDRSVNRAGTRKTFANGRQPTLADLIAIKKRSALMGWRYLQVYDYLKRHGASLKEMSRAVLARQGSKLKLAWPLAVTLGLRLILILPRRFTAGLCRFPGRFTLFCFPTSICHNSSILSFELRFVNLLQEFCRFACDSFERRVSRDKSGMLPLPISVRGPTSGFLRLMHIYAFRRCRL